MPNKLIRTAMAAVTMLGVAGVATPMAHAAKSLGCVPGRYCTKVFPIHVWASQVNVRDPVVFHGGDWPGRWGRILGHVGRGTVHAGCQAWTYPQIGEVHYGPYRNNWWMWVIMGNGTRAHPLYAGYISDVFVSGGHNNGPVAGIPYCG